MRHGRNDYDHRIQDTAGVIPADEPVFLIRGQDKIAHLAVEAYAVLAEAAGHHEAAASARAHAAWMKNWPVKKAPTPKEDTRPVPGVSPQPNNIDLNEWS